MRHFACGLYLLHADSALYMAAARFG